MEISKQAELVPTVLNAIQGKPLSHQDRYIQLVDQLVFHVIKNYILQLVFDNHASIGSHKYTHGSREKSFASWIAR